ncbi:NACHT, LRR and PYD domains-containing protein 4 [Choloepus didactylus]|uniref:NACHT, LRR and PYD domains-containing protein 4 n=1 Tax=Choloepus didactylus TaxID=27675 RepID=UPI00189FDCED|nr:NACHT, LRR and PYD domains-containing protein 4 [Choloepus didactylus]
MESSFFSDYGLMWYLEELRKGEFRKFKELLKQEALQLGLTQISWAEVKKSTREDLANLLIKHREEQQAWDLTFRIFQKINRKDLCEKAKRESTGNTKMYQAHVKKKFNNIWFRESITRIHEYFAQEVTLEEREYLELLFAPRANGEEPRTVVLNGTQGIGKTTLLIKLMLAWAKGTVYQNRFLYVFFFCCREMKQLTVTSLAELISRDWPTSPVPLAEIMSQPERLLFIIDSFEDLKCALEEPKSALCSDWMQQQPVEVVLGSLMTKKMLPESSLLITATPACQWALRAGLERPEFGALMGFDESNRKLFFSHLFQDRRGAMEAFNFVRENEQLFSMCQTPLLCWIVCTCLKQEMERGRDLALSCRRATSLYVSFMFNSFMPKGATCPLRHSQGQLKGLCSLAVEGMWTDTFVFNEEDLRRNGLADSDIPALLGVKALQKHGKCENSYAFIHTCIQEFCAAMFYLLKNPSDHPNPAVGHAEALLLTYLKNRKAHWIYLGCFVFGLLNEKEERRLEAFFGFQLSPKIKQQFLQCLKRFGEHEHLQGDINFMRLFYCLFEMQDEAFVRQVMNYFQEVNFSIVDNVDMMVSAYCVQHCCGLRKLQLSIQNVFKEENRDSPMSRCNLLRWHHVCSVLTTNEHLRELQVYNSCLDESTFVTLCRQLKHPNCRLQKLGLNHVSSTGDSWIFFEALIHNPDLKFLSLSDIRLSPNEVKFLCDVLNQPTCNIEELLLTKCCLSADDCEVFVSVLNSNKKLKHLNVAHNTLGQGWDPLCEALCHPDCTLEALVLTYCGLNESCWENLSEVLLCNKSLVHLDLSANDLKDDGLKLLCEALKHPNGHLQSLCLVKCLITADGCGDLASVLTSNQQLRYLEIGRNGIEDVGVKLLCEALTHPNCHLKNLGLDACGLTGACCADLSSALAISTTLERLSLTRNALDHDGVAVLCEGLRHPECVLKVLGLQKADFDEETQGLLMAEEERNPYLTIRGN